jgi:hypothetical protein
MGEVLMPLLIDGQTSKNVYIIVRSKVVHANINKQFMIVQNNNVICHIYHFPLNLNQGLVINPMQLITCAIGYPRQPSQIVWPINFICQGIINA